MSQPDLEQMTKDQIIAWFKSTNDLSPAIRGMQPATEPRSRPAPEITMLASIRLPVVLVEQLDDLAGHRGINRSEIIREALSAYVAEKTSAVGREEAEHALEVLRRVVAGHPGQQAA